MVATKFCRPRLMIRPEKDKIREMMIASTNNYSYAISLSGASDLDVDQTVSQPPKKRKRLDNLTPEEKLRRKKLKNREAAQTSRDKKKAYVTQLEDTLQALKEENSRLAYQLMLAAEEKDELARKNESLEKELEAAIVGKSEVPRPAAPLDVPLQKESPAYLSSTVLSLTLLPMAMLTLTWTSKISDGWTNSRSLPLIWKNLEKWQSLCLKKASKLKEEASKAARMVGTQPESVESSGSNEIPDSDIKTKEEDEPTSYMVKDEYIIITVPSDDEIIDSDQDEVIIGEPIQDDVDMLSEDSSSYSSMTPGSPSISISESDTDYFCPSSDLGYDSLDSPDTNNIKMLFPELL